MQYVTFTVAGRLLGLDIRQVREINRHLDITPVQQVKPHIRGLINLRGQIVVVFDLGVRLGLGPLKLGPGAHNVVLKHHDVALLVDGLGDVIEVGAELVESPPANFKQAGGRFCRGVLKLPGSLTTVLSVRKLLGAEGEAAE